MGVAVDVGMVVAAVGVDAGLGMAVGVGTGVRVGVGVAVGVKGGVGIAVGVGMGIAVVAGCEQPIATGRTKAMAITIKIAGFGGVSDNITPQASAQHSNPSLTRLHPFSSANGALLRQKIPHYGSVML